MPPFSPTRAGLCPLTAECGAPPGRRHPRPAAVACIGLQGVTEAGIGQGAGATGTQVIHAGGKEGLRRHHSVAAAERGGRQHPAPGIGLTPGSVTRCPARIHLAALGTWPARSRPFWDLGGKSDPDVTASPGKLTLVCYVLHNTFHQIFWFSFKNLPTRTAQEAPATFSLSPFYRWTSRGPEQVRDLSKLTQPVSGKGGLADLDDASFNRPSCLPQHHDPKSS